MAVRNVPVPEVPEPIALVRDFVNTTDHELGTDDLTTPAGLVRHLAGKGLVSRGVRATQADLDLARRLRSGLRRALELNHDGGTDPLPQLAAVLSELPVVLSWTGSGVGLDTTASGVRRGLARIGLAANQATTEGLWWRLKICAFDECEWAFYDFSKNRSRAWCEYGCGNKLKTRAYRARRRAAARAATTASG